MNPNPNTIKNWDDTWTKTGYKYPEMKSVTERKQKVASLIPKSVRVIDVAAGVGQIRQFLHPSVGYIALDFSLVALKLSSGIRIQADIAHLPIKPKSFHSAIAMEILEHVDNPVTFLKRIAALANRQIIVTVPNNRLAPDQNGYHRATYTPESFTILLARAIKHSTITTYKTQLNLIARCLL